MNEYLMKYRRSVETCWGEDTVSSKFLPLDASKPKSLGQCAPTSCLLLERLNRDFGGRRYKLAIGEVRKGLERIIPYHLWVVEVADSPNNNKIIDVTADQSGVLPEIVYETTQQLAAKNIFYIAYELSASSVFAHAETLRRTEKLKAKLDQSDLV